MKEKLKQKIKHLYEHKYKMLLIVPLILLLFALAEITVQYSLTGDFVNKGISLKGGSTITITQELSLSPQELEQALHEKFPKGEITARVIRSAGKMTAVAIDSDAQERAEIDAILAVIKEKISLQENAYNIEIVGSSLGNSFFRQTILSLVIAFLLMSLVVFLYLREPIPSLTVILCAFSDIVVTLAIFNITGMKLSSSGVAAFLMLIGYSVDTDILLSVRVLKRKEGSVMERVYSSVKTGLSMTFTTIIVAAIALLLVKSEVIQQIMVILLIGMFVDMVMTWIQNVAILRWYLERKETLRTAP